MGAEKDSNKTPRREIEEVSLTSVLPEWYEAYEWGNDNYPTWDNGIGIVIGEAMVRSLKDRKVDWRHCKQSEFTDEQLATARDLVIDRHAAFGIDTPSDEAIRDIWNRIVKSRLAFGFLDYAGGWNPASNPQQAAVLKSHAQWFPTDADNEVIETFFTTTENDKKISQLSGLYIAAADTLRSTPALTLAADIKAADLNRRSRIRPARPQEVDLDGSLVPRIVTLSRMISREVAKKAPLLDVPSPVAENFISNIIRL